MFDHIHISSTFICCFNPSFSSSKTTLNQDENVLFSLPNFTGKELDEETGYGYFGARYMDYELMTGWLSVDPMSDKYPSLSPYNYCAWNSIKLVDPDGEETIECDDGWKTSIDKNTGQKTLVKVNTDGGDTYQSFVDQLGPLCSTRDFVEQYSNMGYSVSDGTGNISTSEENGTKISNILSDIGTINGTLASLTFSKSRGKWLGKNGKFYPMNFNGNGTTGGKLKFAKTTSGYLKGAGASFSLLSAASTYMDYRQGDISVGGFASDMVGTGLGFVPEIGWALCLDWNIFSNLEAKYGLLQKIQKK